MKIESVTCKICNKEIKANALSRHLKCKHKWNFKEGNTKVYYDLYLKIENEDKCKFCGKLTQFATVVKGYLECCS